MVVRRELVVVCGGLWYFNAPIFTCPFVMQYYHYALLRQLYFTCSTMLVSLLGSDIVMPGPKGINNILCSTQLSMKF